jgi:glutathione peroxidase
MRKALTALVAVLGISHAAAAGSPTQSSAYTDANQFLTADGEPLDWSTLRGNAVLVVNVASQCGFTPQYEGLQDIADKYADRGFVVLGVPSNDFGGQAPESDEEYKEFCAVNFERPITFPHTQKTPVKGNEAHPFYKWAKAEYGEAAEPGWNFHKLLLDTEGRVVDTFGSRTGPKSNKLTKAIEEQLPKAES